MNWLRKAILGIYQTPFFLIGFFWLIALDTFRTGVFVAEEMMDSDTEEFRKSKK